MRVVIIGGGAIGSAIAYFTLADRNFRGSVTVVERDPSYSRASSALSASSIRQQFSTPINIQIGLYCIEFLRNIGRHLGLAKGHTPGIGLTEPGYLFLATPNGAPILRENQQVQLREGAQIALLDPVQLQAKFPWLATRDLALGALGLSGEGWFDGYSLLQAFRQKAKVLGAHYLQAEAVGFEANAHGINAVRLIDGAEIECDKVVNAAGPWASHVAHWAHIDLPVRARRRTVFVFHSPARLPHCPLVIDPSGVYFRPEGAQFICGVAPHADHDPDEPSLEPQHELFEETVWPVLAQRVPAFAALRQTRSWAGYYEMNIFDANGIVGAHPSVPNLFFANGFSGHGLQQSPAIGRGVSELMLYGGYRTLDLTPLAFERILNDKPLLERNIV